MRTLTYALILCFSLVTSAQEKKPAVANGKPAAPVASKAAEKPDPVRERAMQLLESTEAGSRALDPISHTFVLLQVARAYQPTDKKKTLELLEQAIANAKVAGEEKPSEAYHARELQQNALKVIIGFDPVRADELVQDLQPEAREDVLESLLEHYQKQNKLDRAAEQITAIAQQAEAPYEFTSRLMDAFPPEQRSEKIQLFTLCLSSFSGHPHERATYGDRDFGEMVVKFHKELPAALVEQAIEAVLNDARDIDTKYAETSPLQVSFASSSGAVQVGTAYQYRLFQLLPVLRTVSPDKADRILKEQAEVQSLMQKYPEGLGSLTVGGKRPSIGFKTKAGSGGNNILAGGGSALEAQKAATILKDVDAHPQDALANALTLGNASIKTETLLSIAQASWKKNPTVASQALKKAMDSAEEMRAEQGILAFDRIAHLFLRMEDTSSARSVVERGIKLSERAYKDDINPDDPNRAPKIYWPSTAGWREMLAIAAQVSPTWAAQLLGEIQDEECRTLAQVHIAATLLKVSPKEIQIDNWKKHISMSFYRD